MFSENIAENNIDDITNKFPSVLVELGKDNDYGYERIKFSWEDKNFLNQNKSYDNCHSFQHSEHVGSSSLFGLA